MNLGELRGADRDAGGGVPRQNIGDSGPNPNSADAGTEPAPLPDASSQGAEDAAPGSAATDSAADAGDAGATDVVVSDAGSLDSGATTLEDAGQVDASPPPACTGPFADSFAEFSLVQGQDGWSYGYYVAPFGRDDFVPFADMAFHPADGDVWVTPGDAHWTFVGASNMHPNGTVTSGGVEAVEHHAVRRWQSDIAGQVRIHGAVRLVTPGGGNGVDVRVRVDDIERFSLYIPTQEGGVPKAIDFTTLLAQGSLVDFSVDPHESNDFTDKTALNIVVDCP